MSLIIDRIAKSYGHGSEALYELSLEVSTGQIVALLGHNGAGKSTALKVVGGIVPPTSGSVVFDGSIIAGSRSAVGKELRQVVAYLPENPRLLHYLTPLEYVCFVGQLYGIDEDLARERVSELGEIFRIDGCERRLIRELSAGQRQRVAIAAAVMNRPRLLLLDEPTNLLDPIGVKALKDFLIRSRSEGTIAVLATHRLDVAEALASRVVLLRRGRCVFEGSAEDLSRRAIGVSPGSCLEDLYMGLLND